MKRLVSILLLYIPIILNAQVFHFNDSSTTIIKDITQSPAHWYLEIYNDLNVEDTLWWKAHFVNIPTQWVINFDTQSGYWSPVMDGDSASFILLDSLSLPQKLIIGNATNLTVGHGSIFMDIYDPADASSLVTIEYEYIITGVGANIEEELLVHSILIKNNLIEFNLYGVGNYYISNSIGKIIQTGKTNEQIEMSQLSLGVYFIYVQIGEKYWMKKFIKH